MPKLKEQSSNNIYDSFLETFSSECADRIFDLLEIGEGGDIDIRQGILPSCMRPKREQLSIDIMGAYMTSPPTLLENKAIHPSKQKARIKTLRNTVKGCMEKICKHVSIIREGSSKEVLEREVADNALLAKLRVAARRSSKRDKIQPDSKVHISAMIEAETGGDRVYEFDRRVKRLYEELEWFDSCLEIADQNTEVKKTKLGKRENKYEWGFFIGLCNVFYKYTGKVPTLSYSGCNRDIVGSDHTVTGEVLPFLRLCYEGFKLNFSDEAAADRIKALQKKDKVETPFGIKPDWPVT
ncbi:MAG: hypothetical protein KDD76_06310 [Rickettsiales bacterium]|nr:hypothetical protein [Rickettsiales bacterium]